MAADPCFLALFSVSISDTRDRDDGDDGAKKLRMDEEEFFRVSPRRSFDFDRFIVSDEQSQFFFGTLSKKNCSTTPPLRNTMWKSQTGVTQQEDLKKKIAAEIAKEKYDDDDWETDPEPANMISEKASRYFKVP